MSSHEEENSEEEEELTSVDPYGPDLYGDEQDRQALEAMTEIEREKILTERAEQRQYLLERREIRKKLKASAGTLVNPTTFSQEKLRKKRTRSTSIPFVDADVGLPTKKAAKSFSNEEGGEFEGDYGEEEGEGAEEDWKNISWEEMQKAQITRTQLEKWVVITSTQTHMKLAKTGCYLRLGLGKDRTSGEQIYRAVLVEELEICNKPYKLGQCFTDVGLVCSHGKDKKRFHMDIMSNAPITEREFERYRRVMLQDKIPAPNGKKSRLKRQDLEYAKNYVMTHDDITEMIRKKRLVDKSITNKAVEKGQLLILRDVALQNNNQAEVEEIDARIKLLEAASQDREDSDTSINRGEVDRITKMVEIRHQMVITKPITAATILKKKKLVVTGDPTTKKFEEIMGGGGGGGGKGTTITDLDSLQLSFDN